MQPSERAQREHKNEILLKVNDKNEKPNNRTNAYEKETNPINTVWKTTLILGSKYDKDTLSSNGLAVEIEMHEILHWKQ